MQDTSPQWPSSSRGQPARYPATAATPADAFFCTAPFHHLQQQASGTSAGPAEPVGSITAQVQQDIQQMMHNTRAYMQKAKPPRNKTVKELHALAQPKHGPFPAEARLCGVTNQQEFEQWQLSVSKQRQFEASLKQKEADKFQQRQQQQLAEWRKRKAEEKKAQEEAEQAERAEQARYSRAMAKHVKHTAERSISQYVQTKEELRLKAQFLHDSQRVAVLPGTIRTAAMMAMTHGTTDRLGLEGTAGGEAGQPQDEP